jgi:metal-responsive CopG/Arc/MetJ family transcriptional regulator
MRYGCDLDLLGSKYVSVSLPSELVQAIDEKAIGKLGYRSRPDFIKDAIRRRLEQIGKGNVVQEQNVIQQQGDEAG